MVVIEMVVPRPPAIAVRVREIAERAASERVRPAVKVDLVAVFAAAESLGREPKSTGYA